MGRTQIDEAELMEEIARLSKRNDSGLTVAEWCKKLGRSHEFVRKMLVAAKEKGWLELGKRTMEALDGRCQLVTVYRVVKRKAS